MVEPPLGLVRLFCVSNSLASVLIHTAETQNMNMDLLIMLASSCMASDSQLLKSRKFVQVMRMKSLHRGFDSALVS